MDMEGGLMNDFPPGTCCPHKEAVAACVQAHGVLYTLEILSQVCNLILTSPQEKTKHNYYAEEITKLRSKFEWKETQ